MHIDASGALGRFVRLFFSNGIGGEDCDHSQLPGCNIDPLEGAASGTLTTKVIEISTQIVFVEGAGGTIWTDPSQPIGMEKMQSGQSKIVGLGISFWPDDPDYNYQYDLGQITDPSLYDPAKVCQKSGMLYGTVELHCRTGGQEWEFRTHNHAYVNEPNNRMRLLDGRVLLNYWKVVYLRKWDMPFVLRVTRQ